VDSSYRGAPFMLKFSVNPKVLDTALKAANIIIADTVENGISEDEYQMAQGMTVGLFQLSMGSMTGIASLLTRYTLLGLGFDKIDAVAEQYGAITRDEVNAALRKFIKPENLVTSLAGTFQK
jgi:predicted Zn-dependent peptidase